MYRDAIEANYSHEQMTPLNCILATSKIVLRRILEMHKKLKDEENESRHLETVKLASMINQSG